MSWWEHLPRASAAENLGPHLLGRKPRPADPKDWKLGDYFARLDAMTPLEQLLARISKSNTAKPWATLATSLIEGSSPPAPPAPPPPPPTGLVVWELRVGLDQSQTPHCEGFSGAHWEACAPVEDPGVTNATGHALYYACKVVDGEPKAEDGTDSRSLAKVLQQAGRITNYAYASTIDEIIRFLSTEGPMLLGSDWTEDMFTPDADGRVHPTGPVEGGHAYCAIAYDPQREWIGVQNSWGASWGTTIGGYPGRFWLSAADCEALQKQGGDALAAVELPL